MPFSPVTWAYRDPVTSAKLAAMQENIATHDHREDGTQGAVIVGKAASGIVTEVRSAAGLLNTVVTFPAGRFSRPPRVGVGIGISSVNQMADGWGIVPGSITKDGFTLWLDRRNTANSVLYWVAVERDS